MAAPVVYPTAPGGEWSKVTFSLNVRIHCSNQISSRATDDNGSTVPILRPRSDGCKLLKLWPTDRHRDRGRERSWRLVRMSHLDGRWLYLLLLYSSMYTSMSRYSSQVSIV